MEKERGNQIAKHSKLELTPAEKEIVKEIREKGFLTKILPLVGGSILMCRFLMKRGILSTNRRFWKTSAFGLSGFFAAQVLISVETMRRLERDVPNGTFANISKVRHMNKEDREEHVKRLVQECKEQEEGKHPVQGFSEEAEVPETKSSQSSDGGGEPRKLSSYTELREQSRREQPRREQHPQQSHLPDRPPLPSSDRVIQPPVEEPKLFSDESETSGPRSRGRRNQYGDEIE